MALEVAGNVKALSFVGNIAAENITSGKLALTRLATGPASGSYVLKSLNGNVSWVAESATAGTIAVTNETTYASQAYLLFAKSYGSGGAQLFANDASTSKRIAIKPDTSQILASTDIANITRPGYSFVGVDTAGLYGTTTEIGLVFDGKKQLSIKDGNHTLYNSSTSAVLTTVSTGVSIGSNNTTTFDLFLKAGTGALATPNISWAGDTSTGIWRSAAGKISVSATGVKVLEIGSQLLIPVGTEAAPGISFIGTTNTGMYQASSKINFSVAGALVVSMGTNAFQIKMSSAGAGKALMSTDTSGNATWDVVIPYGTIMIWMHTTAPTGWKLVSGGGKIFISGQYRDIPTMTDRLVVGGTTQTTGGSTTPTTAGSVTLSNANLPRHKHAICTSAYSNQAFGGTYKVNATFTGTAESHTHRIYQGGHCGNAQGGCGWAGADSPNNINFASQATTLTPKGTISMSGYTDDMSTWHTSTQTAVTLPHNKYTQVIFIVKFNPSATANQEGHWTA
jgi:hypothetical protein